MLQTGIVQWFNDITGYGYIEADRGGPLIRVDYREILVVGYRILHEGQRVRFREVIKRSFSIAEEVTPLD